MKWHRGGPARQERVRIGPTMPKSPPPGPLQGLVVFAKSKARVSAFYRATLGLRAAETQTSHDVLVAPGIEVVVHAIPSRLAAGIRLTRPPQVRENMALKPVFVVQDLEAVRAAAKATGGSLKPAEHAWQIRGATVLDGHDPEGNVVQFRQVNSAA